MKDPTILYACAILGVSAIACAWIIAPHHDKWHYEKETNSDDIIFRFDRETGVTEYMYNLHWHPIAPPNSSSAPAQN
jgi:hypothetical protein